MDAADSSYPSRLARQLRFLKDHPEGDPVGTQALPFGANGQPIGKRCPSAVSARTPGE